MIKKTVTYKDYNGNERTEDFYFNLNEAELTELQWSEKGGLKAILEKIARETDEPQLIKYFKEIVLKAYGVKSNDGRNFVKNDKVREDFETTLAYSKIFMELATDDKAAAAFINGIMPPKEDKGNANVVPLNK